MIYLRSLGILALATFSYEAQAISGYAYGKDHCYHFNAPSGWTMDNTSAAKEGVPMVFYPVGMSWQSAPIAIYTRPNRSSKASADSDRINKQVEQVIEQYRQNAQQIKAIRLEEVQSSSGTKGELWQYTGYRNGGAELVVYFPAEKTVNFFVMQLSQAATIDLFLPKLKELALT